MNVFIDDLGVTPSTFVNKVERGVFPMAFWLTRRPLVLLMHE